VSSPFSSAWELAFYTTLFLRFSKTLIGSIHVLFALLLKKALAMTNVCSVLSSGDRSKIGALASTSTSYSKHSQTQGMRSLHVSQNKDGTWGWPRGSNLDPHIR